MKIYKKIILAASIIAAVSITAFHVNAADWKQISDSEESVQLYLDKDSIIKISPTEKKAWIKFNGKYVDKSVLFVFTRDGKYETIEEVDTKTGKVTYPEDELYENITPDSPQDKAFKYVWTKKELKEKEYPNRWERKGEDEADRFASQAVNKALDHIFH